MDANLYIREWDEVGKTLNRQVLVYIDGSWFLCSSGKDAEQEVGVPEYYIDIPHLPDMEAYGSLSELEDDIPQWVHN